MRIHITQEIPGRTRIARHGIGLKLPGNPFGNIGERSFAFRPGPVTIHMRQLQWQITFFQRVRHPIDPFNRERLTPIALPAEGGIAHFIIHLAHPDTQIFQFVDHHIDRLPHDHSVDKITIF